jgi:hypothetical protein
MSEHDRQQNSAPFGYQIEALLVMGEPVRRLSEEQVIALGEALLLFGLDVRPVYNTDEIVRLQHAQAGEQHPRPVLATKQGFLAFAKTHGYSQVRVNRAFGTLIDLGRENYSDRFPDDPYPRIRLFGEGAEEYVPAEGLKVDLRSVGDRLDAGGSAPLVWDNATRATIEFIAHITRERVPQEPEST